MELDEFDEKLGQISKLGGGELWDLLTAFLRERDVPKVMYHHLPPVGAPDENILRIANEGYPEKLQAYYLSQRNAGDAPVANYAQQHVEPVYWDEVAKLKPVNQSQRDYLTTLHDAGLVDGVGFQVFGPNSRNGFVALWLKPGVKRLDPVDLRNIVLAGQSAHLHYCSLLLPTLGDPPVLSKRESEVLGWVARGKSNATIGDILGISAHTVDAHLRKIYLKLGVFDRITAALRGLGFGLILSRA
jgi:LuxR family transcriptional regulator/LuxR family quorum-sensing system transcriptional regulator CciR